eukprot:TRINITY_DN2772_c0_g1_i1.p1 TRINITY_DN2772_c0_g1~~TRINITY_DN2772_c0_g1_i1.p1  ORF type:complete len:406 (-),score=90.05 TRINITY_DN2772_c0_g1_i1:917-2134(-)
MATTADIAEWKAQLVRARDKKDRPKMVDILRLLYHTHLDTAIITSTKLGSIVLRLSRARDAGSDVNACAKKLLEKWKERRSIDTASTSAAKVSDAATKNAQRTAPAGQEHEEYTALPLAAAIPSCSGTEVAGDGPSGELEKIPAYGGGGGGSDEARASNNELAKHVVPRALVSSEVGKPIKARLAVRLRLHEYFRDLSERACGAAGTSTHTSGARLTRPGGSHSEERIEAANNGSATCPRDESAANNGSATCPRDESAIITSTSSAGATNASLDPGTLAKEIENRLLALHPPGQKGPAPAYSHHYRQIMVSLRANHRLGHRLLCGDVTPDQLLAMNNAEMQSDEQKAHAENVRDQMKREAMASKLMLEDAATDRYLCPECNERKCIVRSGQSVYGNISNFRYLVL